MFDNSLFSGMLANLESEAIDRSKGNPGMDPEMEEEMMQAGANDESDNADMEGMDEYSEDGTMESEHILNEVMIMEAAQSIGLEGIAGDVDELGSLLESGAVTEATVVRLDKTARISQLQKAAVFTIAKEKRDPHYKKLVTVWRMERMLEEKLMRKYGAEGKRRAKKHVQKNYRQRGKSFVKIQEKASSKLNPKPGAGKIKTRPSRVIRPSR